MTTSRLRLRIERRVRVPVYEVRANCEFVTYVRAPTAEKAMARADQKDVLKWGKAWSPWEATKL